LNVATPKRGEKCHLCTWNKVSPMYPDHTGELRVIMSLV
jgi:hypothetical protein